MSSVVRPTSDFRIYIHSPIYIDRISNAVLRFLTSSWYNYLFHYSSCDTIILKRLLWQLVKSLNDNAAFQKFKCVCNYAPDFTRNALHVECLKPTERCLWQYKTNWRVAHKRRFQNRGLWLYSKWFIDLVEILIAPALNILLARTTVAHSQRCLWKHYIVAQFNWFFITTEHKGTGLRSVHNYWKWNNAMQSILYIKMS